MPTPERNTGQTSWARRQHQQQQQPTSPFRRARHVSHDVDASYGLSPPHGSSARHRRNFSQTGTLRGAFEVASRLPFTTQGEDLSTAAYLGGTPNQRRRQSYDAMSPESNPPNELVEAYQQIYDAGSLTDLDEYDGDEPFHTQASENYNTQLSPGSSIRDHALFAASDASFTDESPRARVVDYTKDEQRLKRATASRSPVLNRAGSAAGLTSEQLQRREEEEEENQSYSEEDDALQPSMNVPSTWGSKARPRQGWLKTLTRKNETGLGSSLDAPEDFSSSRRLEGSASLKAESPEAARVEDRDTTRDSSMSRHHRVPLSDTFNRISFEPKDEKLTNGDQIPNTPITVYKNSTFSKRSPSKRDSRDLLRKLSRTGSPNQNPNPTAIRTPETTRDRRIYDKTPVVTGAWIDTPMTERTTGFPEHLAKDIIRSPAKRARLAESPEKAESKPDTHSSSTDWRRLWSREAYTPNEEKIVEEEERRMEDQTEERPVEKGVPETNSEEAQTHGDDNTGAKKQESDSLKARERKREKPPVIKPDLPKSALETVLQDHKENKDPLDIGDDTIESLEVLMEQEPTGLKTEEEDDAAYEKSVIEQLELANSASLDMGDLNRLHGKLQSLTENIAKVKVGLNSLEVQVSRDNDVLSSLSKSLERGSTQSQHSHGEGGCQTCKVHTTNSRTYATIPLPRLWRRDSGSRALRLTVLGWCIVVAITWYFSESTMCDYYCHPFVGSVCEGNCLLPDAPRFPFVIPTMLWRWLHVSQILTPCWTILLAVLKLSAQLLGLWDGYVDDEPRVLNLTGEIWVHGSQAGTLPATATATPTGQGFVPQLPQWRWKEQKQTPEAVPSLNLGSNSGRDAWEDVSMDDDEYL